MQGRNCCAWKLWSRFLPGNLRRKSCLNALPESRGPVFCLATSGARAASTLLLKAVVQFPDRQHQAQELPHRSPWGCAARA